MSEKKNNFCDSIFDAIFNDEDLLELKRKGVIAQPLGYKLSVKAIIQQELLPLSCLADENAALREMLESAGRELQSVIERLNEHERKDFRCDQLDPPELTDMQTVSDIQELLHGRGEYYCQCTNEDCGSWYQLGKEGGSCKECNTGKLAPQQVEGWV